MDSRCMIKPVGLKAFYDEVQAVCNKAYVYRRCGVMPNHFIVPMDPGEGRTSLIEYLVDMYKKHQVLPFDSGLDDYLELTFDGTVVQLKQVFATIEAAAVYKNSFTGIIALDISALSTHLNEVQCTYFLNRIKNTCRYACTVFFVSSKQNAQEDRLISKIFENVNGIMRIGTTQYTVEELCSAFVKIVEDQGVSVLLSEKEVQQILGKLLSVEEGANMKKVKEMALEVLHYADFSGFVPVLHTNALMGWLKKEPNDVERGDHR